MKKNYKKNFVGHLTVLLLCSFSIQSQTVNVQIDANCQRYIGTVSELDRTKYFSIHDTGTDAEQTKLRNDYNVTGGRGFWGAFSYGKSKTGEVGVYPASKTGNTDIRTVQKGFIGTEHPANAFKDGINVDVAADWAVEYYKNHSGDGGRQEFYEVMNEPFVHSKDFYTSTWSTSEEARIKLQMAQLYNKVAEKIHAAPELANMKIIGYSSAWPSLEINDFGHWNDNMKLFMDTAGENIYGFSTHLYDGINVIGQDSKRSGSNSEAILDLIENYSFVKWNTIKPHAISEYGAIESGYDTTVYSEIASAQTLRSINHILFGLLDREDRMAVSIPFITGKATWHITAANNYQPYTPTLWIPTNIGEPTPSGWHYSPRIHFYDLWKNVKGKRVLIKSDNPDVQTQAFVDGNKLFVALSNLDDSNQTVNLNIISDLSNLTDVLIKSLKIYDFEMPNMHTETVTQAPSSITLIKDETVMLEYTFNSAITFNNALKGTNYYTTKHLQTINANSPISYTFNNVVTGDGFATLRMSLGRKHNVSKSPKIIINGTEVTVPSNYQGYDQANRDDFFGMIEVPFSAQLLKTSNTITVEFPDTGGRVSSLILNVEKFDTPKNTLSVETISNPCPDVSKGQIIISPLITDNYIVQITGNDKNETVNFSSKYTFNKLSSGTYKLAITSTTNASFRLEHIVEIKDPANLNVSGKVDFENKTATYTLKGGNNYTLKVNNETLTTSESVVELSLENGLNSIEIYTDADCQGVYTDKLLIGNEITVYPNPFSNHLTIDLGLDSSQSAAIEIYSTMGSLVSAKQLPVMNGKIEMNTVHLAQGVYLLSVKTAQSTKNKRLIKM